MTAMSLLEGGILGQTNAPIALPPSRGSSVQEHSMQEDASTWNNVRSDLILNDMDQPSKNPRLMAMITAWVRSLA
jgi:hypothetical protein